MAFYQSENMNKKEMLSKLYDCDGTCKTEITLQDLDQEPAMTVLLSLTKPRVFLIFYRVSWMSSFCKSRHWSTTLASLDICPDIGRPILKPLSDIMDLRHQSNAMCLHVGGRNYTPVVCNESRKPHSSHYPSNNKQQQTKNSSQSTGKNKFLKKLQWYTCLPNNDYLEKFFNHISVARSS